jgi:hypothetical protein
MIRLIALGLIAAAYIATCFVSPYGFWMKDAPAVAKVADLPDAAIPPDIDRQLNFKAIQIEISRPDLPYQPSRIALGRRFRTFEALALPFSYYGEDGYVLYAVSRKRLQIIPLDDAQLANLNAIAGRDLTQGFKLHWWNYMWGWLFAIALGIWLVFQFAHEAKMRRLENEAEDEA